MPDIKGFDAGTDVGLHPQDRGTAAFEQAGGVAFRAGRQAQGALDSAGNALGRGIATIGADVGRVVTQVEQHEDTQATTQAMMQSADFDVQQHQALDHIADPKPDPTDPTGQKMIQPDLNDMPAMIGKQLDDWKQKRSELSASITNAKARERFDRETPGAYERFANKAYAIGGDLAYKAAGNNIIKSVQSSAGLVYDDPTQLDGQLGQLHRSIGDVSGGLNVPIEKRATFQTELEQKSARALIENAVEGAARKGDAGRKFAEDIVNNPKYAEWIGTDKDKLLSHIRTVARNEQADQNAARTLQQRQEKDQALARTDYYVQNADKVSLNDIWHDPAYANRPDLRKEAAGVIETMRKFQNQDLAVSPAVSHTTTLDLMSRMTAPDGNPEKIVDRRAIDQEFIAGHLSAKDHNFLVSQVGQINKGEGESIAKTRSEFFKAYRPTLDTQMMAGNGPSALGNTKLYAFQQDAIKQEQALQAQGKDPRSLYDPTSPDFIGAPKNIAKYMASSDDIKAYNRGVKADIQATLQKYAPGAATMTDAATAPAGSPMDIASRYLGKSETGDHAVLTAFLNQAGGAHLDPATTAWCARFVNSTLAAAHIQGTGSDMARSFEKFGAAVQPQEAKAGDIIVFPRGAPGSGLGHVGFIKAIHGDTVEVLGGNQGNSVSVRSFPLSSATAIRRVGAGDIGKAVPGDVAPATENASVTLKIPPAIRSVRTPEEAYALPPGTRIRLPDGRLGTVPYPEVPMSR